MHSSVPRQGYFWALFQLPPLLYTRIYNATEAVPITSRYYLQEYITLQKSYKIDNDQKLPSSDFFCIFIIFILLI